MSDCCVQLHCHDRRSFKDALATDESLVARAAELGQLGIGLTNHGHLYSAPTFFRACRKYGVKGVIGCEAYEAISHTFDTDPDGPDHQLFKAKYDPDSNRYFHLTLWCQNERGWRNLCALHTQSFTKAYKPKNQPLIDRHSLERYNEGIIVGLGCPQSRTNVAFRHGGYEAAVEAARWYFEVFGDRVYVEVMSAMEMQVRMLSDQRRLAKHYGAKTLGTNDVHYLHREDGVLGGPHHMLVISRKFKSADTAAAESSDQSDDAFGSWYGTDQLFMRSGQEMLQAGIFPDELAASLEVLDRCNFDLLDLDEPKPPSAHVPAIGEDLLFDLYAASHS